MRIPLLFPSLVLSATLVAQCEFDPVITPGEVILCPQETVTLEVGDFDSYIWFQDGQAVGTGATHQVDYFNSGSTYTVQVTLDGCTETSPGVLVDGWVFLPPFVIHEGDEPIAIGQFGEMTYCQGQTLILQMSSTYSENIIWTNNGVPIPEETGSSLVVTESGSYSASGSPAICPNYVAQLGVTVDVEFIEPQQPTIIATGDELCAFPLGAGYTWYLNGTPLGENTACIMVQASMGAYTVFVDYGQNCQVISEPYLISGIEGNTGSSAWSLFPNPSNGAMTVVMDPAVGSGSFYSVFDATGRELGSGWMPLNGVLQLDLQDLPPGQYLFQAAREGRALAPASRFSIVK
jgi:hypothetical protein